MQVMRLTAEPVRALSGRARPPGDKSISHRSLILGALAEGETAIQGLLEGADVLNTAGAMRAFGADVSQSGPGAWRVSGRGSDGFVEAKLPIDFGNSGTGVRLTMGAAARFPVMSVFLGDESLSGRPMARVLDPLRSMGAASLFRAGGLLPVALQGQAGLAPLVHRPKIASAQIKSALLLAGLGAEGETGVIEPKRTRDHSERMLKAFGAQIYEQADPAGGWRAVVRGPTVLQASAVSVPADPSSAGFPAVAAAILQGSSVALEGVCLNPLRTGLYQTLLDMGADLTIQNQQESAGETVGDILVRGGGLRAVSPPAERASDMIDEFPILAVACAFAEGTSVLSGAEELRVKESDRIALMVNGLRACGVDVEERPDGMVIEGRGPGGVRGGALVETHGDHRIAMSFLILGSAAQHAVTVKDADMIATSFPNFAGFMGTLGARISPAT
jgi:3-phosphoshikimate 1-carboxyvinyltransferase